MITEEQEREEWLGSARAGEQARRVLATVNHLRGLLLVCVFGTLLASLLEVGLPQVIRFTIDHYLTASASTLSPPARTQGIFQMAAVYASILVVVAVVRYLAALGLNRVGQAAILAIRAQLFEQLHRLSAVFFDRNPVGRLVTRVANDTGAMGELFTGVLSSLLSDVLTFLAIWIALVTLSPGLTALLFAMAIPLLVLTLWFKKAVTRVNRLIRIQLARLNAFLQENIQGLAVIKSFTAETERKQRFEELNQDYYQAEMNLVALYAIFRPVFGCVSIVALALVLGYGGIQVVDDSMSLGSLVAFVFYLKMLFAPLDDMAEKFNVFQGFSVAAERVFRILDTPPEPGSLPFDQRPAVTTRAQGKLSFRDVVFAYNPDKPVLRGVSFEVEPGQSVALVGPTGSGKTTIVSLLTRLYALEGPGRSGQILLDDVPIERWDLNVLRHQIGMVAQELFLFRASLSHNVTLWDPPPKADLDRAISVSRAIRVVERLPQGLETPLGERGMQISQGERQLVSFARALLGDPPIMVLDEATSNIDSLTEQAIQEALADLLRGRTSLVVAHRLSTIRACDKIVVLRQGEVVEQGNHEELLARDGLYAHLYRTQLLEEQLRTRRPTT